MAILTRQILENIGIHLDEHSYKLLAQHFDTTLQQRIIDEIIDELTTEQAEELAQLQLASVSDEELHQWLTANVPDLREIVSDEVDILLGELAEDSEKF